MKVMLTSPITPMSPSPYSHRSAQGEIYAEQIRELGHEVIVNYGGKIRNYREFDAIYVYHGNDFSGGLNLFGGLAGLSDPHGLVELFSTDIKIYSIGIPMPDYATLIEDRLKKSKDHDKILDTIDWSFAKSLPSRSIFLKSIPTNGHQLIVGDSHATSLYRPGFQVNSIPFKTLHGALNIGLENLVNEFRPHYDWDGISFYFGNIDIRHHLCRESDPEKAAKDLATRYFEQAASKVLKPGQKIKLYEPLPIENESRKLPKTGFYKGTPFYGSWKQRTEVRKVFIETLEYFSTYEVRLIKWTDQYLNSNNELDFSHMEKPRSVHLARASYPYWTGIPEKKETSLEGFFA